jgi:hypothetical protein
MLNAATAAITVSLSLLIMVLLLSLVAIWLEHHVSGTATSELQLKIFLVTPFRKMEHSTFSPVISMHAAIRASGQKHGVKFYLLPPT